MTPTKKAAAKAEAPSIRAFSGATSIPGIDTGKGVGVTSGSHSNAHDNSTRGYTFPTVPGIDTGKGVGVRSGSLNFPHDNDI